MTESSGRVVDADGHVLEPADMWLKYLEPSYRDRAIRIARDDEGYEVLLIDGRPLKTLRGQLSALGGIEMDTRELLTRGHVTYAEGCPPGGYDPLARLQVMDGEGIDAAVASALGGRCPSLAEYVRRPKATGGATAAARGLMLTTLSVTRAAEGESFMLPESAC